MAVPFRRTSKTKKRMRRTHLKKDARNVVICPNCKEPIQPHRACTNCGFYKGKNVLEKDEVLEKDTETKTVKTKTPKKEEKKTTTKKTNTKKEAK